MRAYLAVLLITVAACGTEENNESTESAATTCTQVGQSWWNSAFPDQTGKFHIEFDATPSGSNIDAVVGVGPVAAHGFTGLAAIVRFNSSGGIDARAGDQYRSDYSYQYYAGLTYHVRMDIDVKTHTYSAYFGSGAGSTNYYRIATDLPFRTEQANVTHLAYASSFLDSPGSLQLCGVTVVQDATTADGCVVASAGDGFVDMPQNNATVLDSMYFYATPTSDVDAVIGLSTGPATAFSNLATAVRFAPTGYMDVRDGDNYRADQQYAYGTRTTNVRAIADITTHTYSVELANGFELAHQYHFRTQQNADTHLDHMTVIVDSSTGSIRVCQAFAVPSQGVTYSREGSWNVAPLPNGQAILSDGATTSKVDAAGHVLAQVARGGNVAADASGNVFLANIAGTTLTVEKLDPNLASLWVTTATTPADASLLALTVDSTGAPGVTARADSNVEAWRFTPAGAPSGSFDAAGQYIALAGGNVFVAWGDDQAFHIDERTLGGTVLWSNAYSGRAGAEKMVSAPDGSVIVGGHLGSPMDFGGGTLQPFYNPEEVDDNSFIVRLTSTGTHVFSQRVSGMSISGLATNGQDIVFSYTWWTQLRYPLLSVVTMTGAAAPDAPVFDTGLGEHGSTGEVFIAADGRIWWNMSTAFPTVSAYPYLLAL